MIRWDSGTCLRALSLSFTLSEGMLCCSVDTSRRRRRRRRQVRMMMNCVFQEGTVRAGDGGVGGGVTIPTKSQPDDKIMSICTCTNNFHSSIPPSNVSVLLVIFAIGSSHHRQFCSYSCRIHPWVHFLYLLKCRSQKFLGGYIIILRCEQFKQLMKIWLGNEVIVPWPGSSL